MFYSPRKSSTCLGMTAPRCQRWIEGAWFVYVGDVSLHHQSRAPRHEWAPICTRINKKTVQLRCVKNFFLDLSSVFMILYNYVFNSRLKRVTSKLLLIIIKKKVSWVWQYYLANFGNNNNNKNNYLDIWLKLMKVT